MKRATLIAAVVMAVGVFALPAQAHNWNGEGDCDGWTLQLDGTWNAVEIFVDGTSVGLDQTISIPDTSEATSRQFVVTWDKYPAGQSRRDVTVIHTLERELDCEIPEDTTTTTTTPEETTTTTTTPEETTTTVEETTTTTPSFEAVWSAVGRCEDGIGSISVDFDPAQIVRVDVTMIDPVFGEFTEGIESFLEPGTKDATILGPPVDFRLTAIGREGAGPTDASFIPVPESITVTVTSCTDEEPTSTSTTAPVETTTTQGTPPETLPFTGLDHGKLTLLAAGLLGVGAALTVAVRGREDESA